MDGVTIAPRATLLYPAMRMTTLSPEQVAHIAKLARLTLTQDEIDKMTKELSSILDYVTMLSEVNTDNVEPTAQVTGLQNSLREDIVRPSEATGDLLLGCSPLPIIEHQIHVPHAHG